MMTKTNKQQEKRRGITPRLTLNLAPLPEIPYGNCGNGEGFVNFAIKKFDDAL